MLNLNLNWVSETIKTLAQWWPVVKSNLQSIQDNYNSHAAGTADKHAAEHITYSGNVYGSANVKQGIDNLKDSYDGHVNGNSDKHAAEHIAYSGNVVGATNVKEGIDNLNARVDTIITTPIDGQVAAQELVDARGGKPTLGARLDEFDTQLAEKLNKSLFTSTVFKAGVDFGAQYFRIPFMCITKQGTIIAGGDVRYNGINDFGIIDIGVARSEDKGKTWKDKQIIIQHNNVDPTYSRAMDSCVIYDDNHDKLYVFAVKLDDSTAWMDKTDKTNWDLVYTTSTDDGKTWTAPVSIKSIINSFADRVIFLTGVGSGIVMANGTIVLPIQVNPVSAAYRSQSGIVFSTDGGNTWQMSQSLVPEDSSECNIVEYEPGHLLLNARSDSGDKRVLYYTTDMGVTWIANNSNLPNSPERLVQLNGCMGSTIKIQLPSGKEKILYSAPHNLFDNYTEGRSNISVMLSVDRGETWKMVASVYSGITDGYSCLAYRDHQLFDVIEINGDIIFKDISYMLPLILRDDKAWNLSNQVSLTNIIQNSDFSNGTVGWVNNGLASFTAENNEVTALADSQDDSFSIVPGNMVAGHIYYARAYVKSTSNKVFFSGGPPIKYHTGSNNYENLSTEFTAVGPNHGLVVRDSRTTGFDNFYAKYFVVIDLTASFGSGKEPSVERMDYIMSQFPNMWFSGTTIATI